MMFGISAPSAGSQFRPSETIWLESEQFEEARQDILVNPTSTEVDQWQLYLNAIARISIEQWLQKQAASHVIDRTGCINQVGAVYNLKVDGFKLTLIVKEHVLDEVAEIPREALDHPELAAHFYLLLEVSEEQQCVTLRGFLRYDRVRSYCSRRHPNLQAECYNIPLSVFDPELNHLLLYCDFLVPAQIPLPMMSTAPTTPNVIPSKTASPVQSTLIHLRPWIQGIFAEGWQSIDALFNVQDALAWNTRSLGQSAKRGKLLDLGMQLQDHKTILLVNVTEESEQILSVQVQLHPTGRNRYLPPQITLALISQTGEKLQEVCSRNQDNYIQLKSFKGQLGIPFRIGVGLGEVFLYENFEL